MCYEAPDTLFANAIVRTPVVSDWDYDEISRVVRAPEIQAQSFFKVASLRYSFNREVDILVHMKNTNVSKELRISTIIGLVQWEHEPSIGGVLIEYIPDAKTLDEVARDAPADDRPRWMLQIRQTVKQLHDTDIIWGDVKPDSVVIKTESQAWVMDFGGGYFPRWVDKELEGTKEGDWQGLMRLEEFLEHGQRTDSIGIDGIAEETSATDC